MLMLPTKKRLILVVALVVFYIMVANGYAGDHLGDYMNDQAPEMYGKATGWKKPAGYALAFIALAYSCRKIWIDLKAWRKNRHR